MDSLANYGSDDDYEETTEERKEVRNSYILRCIAKPPLNCHF